MTIKKAFVEIVELLEANENSKVKSILPDVIQLASAKQGGGGGGATTFHKNEDGEVVGIRCFYHGKWMSPAVVEFGKKASSSTGLNSMCKDGVSKWTKQQRQAKLAKEELLTQVASGEVDASELTARLEQIEADRNTVVPFTATETVAEGYGFDTVEELIASL